MRITGERIIVFGDSLSHHGPSEAPEIWDVGIGSNRASGAPGDLLASILKERGAAAARVNANVSRSAGNFWTKTARYQFQTADQLLASDRAWKPTQVVIWLGTNDAYAGNMNAGALTKIRDVYRAMGAEVWGIGPASLPTAPLRAGATNVLATMCAVLGADRVIDAQPLTADAARAGDGVHFTATGAKVVAPRLADALAARSQPGAAADGTPGERVRAAVGKLPSWLGPAGLFVGILAGGLLLLRTRRGALAGLRGYYDMPPDAPLPIAEVARRYVKQRDKAYDAINPEREDRSGVFWYPLDEVYPYREYDRTRDAAKGGAEGWDQLVASMRAVGWTNRRHTVDVASIEPAHIFIGKNGKVKVGEGNHRLAIAKQLGLKRVPVRFHFYEEVTPSDRGGRVHQLAGPIDIVDGKRWERMASPAASGYRTVPCKSGLSPALARCWGR